MEQVIEEFPNLFPPSVIPSLAWNISQSEYKYADIYPYISTNIHEQTCLCRDASLNLYTA